MWGRQDFLLTSRKDKEGLPQSHKLRKSRALLGPVSPSCQAWGLSQHQEASWGNLPPSAHKVIMGASCMVPWVWLGKVRRRQHDFSAAWGRLEWGCLFLGESPGGAMTLWLLRVASMVRLNSALSPCCHHLESNPGTNPMYSQQQANRSLRRVMKPAFSPGTWEQKQ